MEFGQRVSLHRGTIRVGGVSWYLGALCTFGGVVTLVRGIGPLVAHGDSGVFLDGAALLVLGFVLLILPILRSQQLVEVRERGLVWTRLLGSVTVPREHVRYARWTKHVSKRGSYDEIEVRLDTGKTLSMVGVEAPE